VTSTHPHHFHPGTDPTARPLVLLHGSGGDEHTLLPLAAELAPDAAVLSLRGDVSIDGGFAFFYRHADRTIDEPDIAARVPIPADFIAAACGQHGIGEPPLALGFSNGSIMAAALLFTRTSLFSGAMLFRPLSPFREDPPMHLDGIPVLIIDGDKDSRRSVGDGALVAARLTRAGAVVTHHVLPVGHAITELDRQIARTWIAERHRSVGSSTTRSSR